MNKFKYYYKFALWHIQFPGFPGHFSFSAELHSQAVVQACPYERELTQEDPFHNNELEQLQVPARFAVGQDEYAGEPSEQERPAVELHK